MTPLLLLACTSDPSPDGTTWLAAGTVRRGRFEGQAFLGHVASGEISSLPARDRASPSVAERQAAELLATGAVQAVGSGGPVRLLGLDQDGPLLVGDALGEDGVALLWSGPAAVRPLAVQHASLEADREAYEKRVLETSLGLEPPQLDCGASSWTATSSELGTVPLVYAHEGQLLASAWATTHSHPEHPDQHGTILVIESDPPRSSQTAPWLSLCVDAPALDVVPVMWVQLDGRELALVRLRCDCLDERWALVDIQTARAVLWSG